MYVTFAPEICYLQVCFFILLSYKIDTVKADNFFDIPVFTRNEISSEKFGQLNKRTKEVLLTAKFL